jgi:hypothetical protein
MHASDWMTTWWRLTLNLLSTRSWSFFAQSSEKKWVHENVIFRSVYNGQLRLCMSLLCVIIICVIIEPTALYDSGNSQKSGNRVRNQKIRSEITLEIKKSHYKSTEIRLEINRNQIRNQEIRLEITWSFEISYASCGRVGPLVKTQNRHS